MILLNTKIKLSTEMYINLENVLIDWYVKKYKITNKSIK